MTSRRELLRFLGGGMVCGFATPTAGAASSDKSSATKHKSGRVLTTIAYNILKCTGWPPDLAAKRLGDVKRQVPERLALELACYKPDVVNFSEAPTEPVVRRVAERLGMNHVFFRSGEAWPGAILTRFDIVEHRNCPLVKGRRPKALFTRHWGRATLETNLGRVIVHSAHLNPSNPSVRRHEVLEVVKSVTPDVEAGRSVLLQGDLNHPPKWPSYPLWIKAGLTDCQATAGNGDQGTINAARPRLRIDYVFAAGPIAKRLKHAQCLFEGAYRTNPDDRGSFALSDHLPVMARFER
jgi:endonuclease/exonuclease/phosphatase family metal-dependent hydrolase